MTKKILTEDVIPSLKEEVKNELPKLPKFVLGADDGIALIIKNFKTDSFDINYRLRATSHGTSYSNDLTIPAATSTKAGLMTAGDKSKLAEIESSLGNVNTILQEINGTGETS